MLKKHWKLSAIEVAQKWRYLSSAKKRRFDINKQKGRWLWERNERGRWHNEDTVVDVAIEASERTGALPWLRSGAGVTSALAPTPTSCSESVRERFAAGRSNDRKATRWDWRGETNGRKRTTAREAEKKRAERLIFARARAKIAPELFQPPINKYETHRLNSSPVVDPAHSYKSAWPALRDSTRATPRLQLHSLMRLSLVLVCPVPSIEQSRAFEFHAMSHNRIIGTRPRALGIPISCAR